MQVNRDQFLEQGYVILRNVIPPALLDNVRAAYEKAVDRQRALWTRERTGSDPPGGIWETAAQPRLHLSRNSLVDGENPLAVEIWLHENLHGVSSRLLDIEDAAVTEMMLMCSPVKDHGPAKWHRDFFPAYCAPLQAYADDILESGPRYVQWNIPLYDDSVLWVVPGSHIRRNTGAEDRQLIDNVRAPLDSAIQTHLSAGDGVAYILPLLHWGSNYSPKMRRTVHGGFSDFTHYPHLGYLPHLSSQAQDTFTRWHEHSQLRMLQAAAVLRAAIAQDGPGYRAALDEMHPGRGPKGQLQSTIFLSKAARRIRNLKRPDFDMLPDWEQNHATSMHPMTLQWGEPIAELFSDEEAEKLWAIFKPVDDAMQDTEPQWSPGFQGDKAPYYFVDVPAGLTVDRFTAGWDQKA